MKSVYSKSVLLTMAFLLAVPMIVSAQTTKPRLRRTSRTKSTRAAAAPLVPVGTNLKVRLQDTLSSQESRAAD